MAENVYVRPPDAMDVGGGNPSAAWDKWKLKFKIFLQATAANGKQDTVKVGLLLNHIGDEGIEMFSNFAYLPERPDPDDENRRLSAESKDDYATVIREFDEFFNRRDPLLVLRERYWLHRQREPSRHSTHGYAR